MSITAECEVCKKTVSNGHGNYDLKQCHGYEMWVCSNCFDGNRDGWAPHHEPTVLAHLQTKGLPIPERNLLGLLPLKL